MTIVIDQFRYDYLLRFRSTYNAGFARLLRRGAVFTSAHYVYAQTSTAPGHATILSGANPSVSGIIDDAWYDRAAAKYLPAVFHPGTKVIGGLDDDVGSSPHQLLVSTVADELKVQGIESIAIGLSWKDRGAVLPAGRTANAAYWYDKYTDHFVTSSYYRSNLPAWLCRFNEENPTKVYAGRSWLPLAANRAGEKSPENSTKPFCVMATQPGIPECWLPSTPWANEILEQLAERAISGERLGRHGGTDVLTISFSANDWVGHDVGPDHAQVRDMAIRTDQVIGKLLDYIDAQVGPGKSLIVLTADHGVGPLPEFNKSRNMPGGRVPEKRIAEVINKALNERFGTGAWLLPGPALTPYLNLDLIHKRNLDAREVERTAVDALTAEPHVARVYSRYDLARGGVPPDTIVQALSLGFYGPRSGDLFIVLEPYYLTDADGTGHGTPYGYDTHVPLIFVGPHVRAGTYTSRIAINDIAPTLSLLLGIDEPSGSVGRPLSEILE